MPTFTSQPDGSSGIDTRINSYYATTNYDTGTTFAVGEQSSASAIIRSLIKFDLTTIPANARPSSAYIALIIQADDSSNARDFKMYRILVDWVKDQVT